MASKSGTPGPDKIRGSVFDDLLEGLDGDDTLAGGYGNDTLYGGRGSDLIVGEGFIYSSWGIGDDLIYAGAGNDTVNLGLPGITSYDVDTIFGGSGDDVLSVDLLSPGSLLYGEVGSDTIDVGAEGVGSGGPGNDYIVIENGMPGVSAAVANGDAGDDLVIDRYGSASISGGDGDDVIIRDLWGYFEQDRDTISGGSGDDSIVGFRGMRVDGGDGVDVVRITMSGFLGSFRFDARDLSSGSFVSVVGVLLKNVERLEVEANRRDDSVHLRQWNDYFWGAHGNDTLFGGGGDDQLDGGPEVDKLSGGAGNDTLFGSAAVLSLGEDTLRGGAGDDFLIADHTNGGGYGLDIMRGGTGSDGFAFIPSPSGIGEAERIVDFDVDDDWIGLWKHVTGVPEGWDLPVKIKEVSGTIVQDDETYLIIELHRKDYEVKIRYDRNTGVLWSDDLDDFSKAPIAVFLGAPKIQAYHFFDVTSDPF